MLYSPAFYSLYPILPYARLDGCKNLRNILRREDVSLLERTGDLNKTYRPERTRNTPIKAIKIDMAQGHNGEQIPLSMAIVNYYGYPLVDVYIQPYEDIKDWNTHKTGIHPDKWNSIENDGKYIHFEEAQDIFFKYFGAEDILVGHNVDENIAVLNVDPADIEIIDTQKFSCYPGDGLPRRPGLKSTVVRYFNIEIQTGTRSPLEDARAAMLLYRTLR